MVTLDINVVSSGVLLGSVVVDSLKVVGKSSSCSSLTESCCTGDDSVLVMSSDQSLVVVSASLPQTS